MSFRVKGYTDHRAGSDSSPAAARASCDHVVYRSFGTKVTIRWCKWENWVVVVLIFTLPGTTAMVYGVDINRTCLI